MNSSIPIPANVVHLPTDSSVWVKRAFDVFCSLAGLLLLSPVFLVIACLVRVWGGAGGIFYRQQRVGQFGKLFWIWKFRTMAANAETAGPSVTRAGDPRITRIGAFLRRFKLDELPQLWNVANGEMSLVGPRPEVPLFVERYSEEQRSILRLKPGITDLATLCFREEEVLLEGADGVEEFYVSHCLPKKITLNERYAANANVLKDVWIILQTLLPYSLCVVPIYGALLVGALLLALATTGNMPANLLGWAMAGSAVVLQLIALFFRKEFSGLLSFFGWAEFKGMVMALSLASASMFLFVMSGLLPGWTVETILVDLFVSLALLGGIRMALRFWRQWSISGLSKSPARQLRVGIVGAGEEGASLAREIARRPDLGRTVTVFFDDDPTIWRKRLHDIPVEGMPECLLQQQWDERVDEIIFAVSDLQPARFKVLREAFVARRFRQYHFGGLSSLFGSSQNGHAPSSRQAPLASTSNRVLA
jgi:lipopolysaccharide/colanic/teichoic acid biosynthesis glycosyltransferase